MWKILLPSGEYLDTPPDFALQFELNNQVFSTSSTSVLPGSFTFPVTVPLTGRMKAQLQHPHLVDNSRRWSVISGVWVYGHGAPLFYGSLRITDADPHTVKLTIVANPLAAFKEILLSELDFGGDRAVAPSSWEDHMKETVRFPEDYDYAFLTGTNEEPFYNFNRWNSATGAFVLTDSLVTPMVKLKYLLERMWAADPEGFGFTNAWQADDLELGRLYLFNNVDVRNLVDDDPDAIALPDSFSLNRHVPKVKCSELLKKLTAQWCLGFFTNVFDRKVRLLSLQEVLSRPPRHDWTNYRASELQISEGDDVPGYYNYEQPNTLPPDWPPVEDMTLIPTYEEYAAGAPWAEGYYYIETNNVAFYVDATGFARPGIRCFRGVRPGDGSEYEAGMDAVFDNFAEFLATSEFTGWHAVPDTTPQEYEYKENDYPLALLAYRGLQNYIIGGGGPSPVVAGNVWLDGVGSPGERLQITTDGAAGPDAARSLHWFGDYGLYNTAHRNWAEMLITGKHCTQSFALPIGALTSFSFEDKVRIGNMDFFCKRIRVRKLLGQGRVLVEASMVSVI